MSTSELIFNTPIFPCEIWAYHILNLLNLYDWNNMSRVSKVFSVLFQKELYKRKSKFSSIKVQNTNSRYGFFFELSFLYGNSSFKIENLSFHKVNDEFEDCVDNKTLFYFVKFENSNFIVDNDLTFKLNNGYVFDKSIDSELQSSDYIKNCNLLVIETFFLLIHQWYSSSSLIRIKNKEPMISKKRKIDSILATIHKNIN